MRFLEDQQARDRGDIYSTTDACALPAPCSLKGYIGFINHSADQFVGSLAPMAKSGDDVEIWRLVHSSSERLTLATVATVVRISTVERMGMIQAVSPRFQQHPSD